MKAAIYYRPGEPDELCYVDVPEPQAGEGELLIRVEAISIEGGELLARRYMDPGSPPGVPGYSAAGEVIAVGANVTEFAAGDKVTSFAFQGAYAELRAVPASACWKLPDGLDVDLAATVPVAFGTAALALNLAGLKQGEAMLLQGAGGGVGIAAIQLARLAGAKVIGTGRRIEALESLRAYGLDHALVIGDEPVKAQVERILGGRGADVLVDNVGGSAFQDGLDALRDGGRAVIVGIAGPGEKTIDTTQILARRLSVFGCFLGPIMYEPPQRAMIADALAKAAAGQLVMPIDATFPLSDAAEGHRRAEVPGRTGRIILKP